MIRKTSESCQIYTDPQVRKFSKTEAGKLADALRTIDNNTSLRVIHQHDELQMNYDGTTKDGYRFSYEAFCQAASLLAPGLVGLMPDLAGVLDTKKGRENIPDSRCAIDLWNHLVDIRFVNFSQRRLMRNEAEKTIEGFLGSKYMYLENLSLFNEASQMLELHAPESTLYAGLIVGRRLCLWYRADQPMFKIDIDGKSYPFYYGHYFANGESTGTSVKGTLAVFTSWGVCLANFKKYGAKMSHAGKSFNERLGRMFTKVCQQEIPVDDIINGARKLNQTLGFEANWTTDQVTEKKKSIINTLGFLHISKRLATEITDWALTEGRYRGHRNQLVPDKSKLYASRKIIDLLVPLMHVARTVPPEQREKHEQAAFDLLLGTTNLTK